MSYWYLIVLCVAWLLGTAFQASRTIPRLPLDSSPSDPATMAAFNAALTQHFVLHAAIALAPLLVVLAASALMKRRD